MPLPPRCMASWRPCDAGVGSRRSTHCCRRYDQNGTARTVSSLARTWTAEVEHGCNDATAGGKPYRCTPRVLNACRRERRRSASATSKIRCARYKRPRNPRKRHAALRFLEECPHKHGLLLRWTRNSLFLRAPLQITRLVQRYRPASALPGSWV